MFPVLTLESRATLGFMTSIVMLAVFLELEFCMIDLFDISDERYITENVYIRTFPFISKSIKT